MYKLCIFLLAIAPLSLAASQRKSLKSLKPDKYVRPCHVGDIKCVRDNLVANSKCKKHVKGAPSKYTVDRFEFETPYFNSSYVDHNLVIQNLNKCTVSEFFFNVKSDTAVLAIDCRDLILSSNRTLIQHVSYKEDNTYSYTSTWRYPLIRMTANIKNAYDMDLCNTFVFTDVAVMPKFVLSPNDKPTKDFLSTDLSFLNIYERETFFYRGPTLYKKFLNTAICDCKC